MKPLKKASPQVRVPGVERKRIILDQALELFASRGFHGVTVNEVATASKVTKPVLYDHFSSKSDLYIQVSKEIRERLLAAGRHFILPPQSFAARIRAGVGAFFRFAETNPAVIRVLLSPPRHERKLYRAVQAIQDEATNSIVRMIIAAGVRTPGSPTDTQKLTVQVEFIKRGLHAVAEWRVQHADVPGDVVIDAISNLIRSGLLNE
jgi:AcrR family transcriptional regulator